MFIALEVSLVVIEKLVPVEKKIRRQNASLAGQISTASESICLNLGEGRWRKAGDQRRHWEMAAGSTSGLTVALRIALAKGYVAAAEIVELDAALDRLRGLLYGLTQRCLVSR